MFKESFGVYKATKVLARLFLQTIVEMEYNNSK